MDFVLVLGPDIQDTDIQARVKKNWEFFLKKNQVFLAEKRRRLTWWPKLDWYKKSPRPCYLSWWRMVSVSFVSVEKYELQMRKNFRNFFHLFFAQKSQSEKTLTSFFSKNVAYETLVYYTKPWTLYLVSVLRNKGRKLKNSKNLRFIKTSFQKNHEAEFFLKIYFNEKVVKDSTHFLAWTKVFRISFQFWGKSVTNYEKLGNFTNFFFIPLFAQKIRNK